MEIKINKEIRSFTESIFFGLSMRQFLFSLLAAGLSVAMYFCLKDIVGLEVVSWLCILCALPCAALGFLKYNGMPFEKLIVAVIRSEFIMPSRLTYRSENTYRNIMDSAEKGNSNEKKK